MKKPIAILEMFLLISASFAFSAMLHESESVFVGNRIESDLISNSRGLFLKIFGNNLVSAADGLWTCPMNLNGTACQEYPAANCRDRCSTDCFPGLRADFAQCALGTCIDSDQGVCSPNAPRGLCEQQGGSWDPRQKSEIASCSEGCCLIGDQALYRTESACNALRQQLGKDAVFEPVDSELACLALANRAEEGACMLDVVEGDKRNCKFISKEECSGLRGDFYGGLLCSNTQLNSVCEKMKKTSCIEGKDEVYWIDSCGNRENIYDSLNKEKSWNNGLALGKNESCALGTSSNPFSRQSSCGNCNYLGGSVCGAPNPERDDSASVGQFICKDLSCVDESGNTRKHGESWCKYEGQVGAQGIGNLQRSVALPGSEQFRLSCLNGEVISETCGSARNSVCAESRDDKAEFSSAACRPNQWQLCVKANSAGERQTDATGAATKVKEECEKYTDCVYKSVDLKSRGKDTFAFNVCVPRYPPGFDLDAPNGGDVAELTCGMASASCTYVKVKKLFGSDKYNQLCRDAVFAETMNNLCMSMGDCGANINVLGSYTDSGYSVSNSPGLREAYVQGVKQLKDAKPGQKVDPLSPEEVSALLGSLNTAQDNPNVAKGLDLGEFLKISGFGGILMAGAIYAGAFEVGSLLHVAITSLFTGTNLFGATAWPTSAAPVAANIGAFASAAAGALIGAAGTAWILDELGITQGLPPLVAYALIATGAAAGGFLTYGVLQGGSAIFAAGGGLAATGVGLIILAVLVIIIAIFAFLGIGKKSETKISFQCLPWQPPLGGSQCGKCGEDVPCTKYTCQSLGQTCKFIENSANERCVDTSPNDVSAPIIAEDSAVLTQGYSYEQISERGYTLKGPEANGCVSTFADITIGIKTDELAQCKVANAHTGSYEDMDRYFSIVGGRESNLFRKQHTAMFTIPTKESMDNRDSLEEDGEEYDPELFEPDQNRKVNLYIRCTDPNGRKNLQEYSINFCVSPEPDRTAPVISRFDPISPGYAALNSSLKEVKFFVNEPAECRWNEGQDVAYELMTKNATCETELAGSVGFGWPCVMNLPATKESSFYVRCSDQPFLEGNSSRNTNQQGTQYSLRKTSSALRIVSMEPNNKEIITNGLPASVDLKITTAGGIEELPRKCSFRWGTQDILFLETGTNVHRQNKLNLFSEGNYSIPITCEDGAGNKASDVAKFSIKVDDAGPVITRVYASNGLTVITNENARCAYSLNSCSFAFANGTLLAGDKLVHSTGLIGNVSQYIICRDIYENVGSCVSVQGAKFI